MFYMRMVFRNIRRQGLKSLLAVFICVLAVLFLFVYMGNISANQKQLDRLPDALPVSAQISNHSGSQVVGLMIDGSLMEQLGASDTVKDLLYTTRLAANIAPETPEEEAGYKTLTITGANDLAALPLVKEEDISLTAGSVRDLLRGRQASVIAWETFLEDNHVKPGDNVTLALYCIDFGQSQNIVQYRKIGDIDVTIMGSFTLSEATGDAPIPAMICAAGWAEELLRAYGLPFYADSASCFVRDPFRLNDFKAEMRRLGFMSVDPQAKPNLSGLGLSVNDKTFISSAGSLQKNLSLTRAFLPFILLLIILVGYIASTLMTQSRRPEAAVMRSMGVSQTMCAVVLSVENAALALSGCLAGILASALLTDIDPVEGIVISAVYFAGHMIGSVVAVLTLGRFSVMEVLTKAE
jgi:hypothetical protein